jgi:hypothetical protein
MPLHLRCDCGHELHLADDEAKELTWCPRCRKILVQPSEYASGPGTFVQRGSTSGSAGGRIGAGIAVAVVLAFARLACVSTTDYTPRTYEVPDFTVPQFQFQGQNLPDLPPPDGNPLPPGFLPPGAGGNPFPLEKEPPAKDGGPVFPPRDPDDP